MYYTTKHGLIIDENDNIVSIDNLDYIAYLRNGGEVKQTDKEIENDYIKSFSVPQELTRSQLRQALLIKGISETNIVAAINAIQNELNRNIMLIKWEDQPTYRRQNEDLKSIGAALNLSDKDINEIFELGATL